MKVKSYSPPTKNDFKDIPESIFKLLSGTTSQVEDLTQALQSRLEFVPNFNAEVRTVSLSDDTSTKVKLQRVRTALWVAPIWEERFEGYKFTWQNAGENSVNVKIIWDSSPTDSASVKLLILGQ